MRIGKQSVRLSAVRVLPPLAREVNHTVKAVYRCLSAGIFSIFRVGGYIDSHKLKKVSPPVLGGLFFYRAYKCIIFFSWLYRAVRGIYSGITK